MLHKDVYIYIYMNKYKGFLKKTKKQETRNKKYTYMCICVYMYVYTYIFSESGDFRWTSRWALTRFRATAAVVTVCWVFITSEIC